MPYFKPSSKVVSNTHKILSVATLRLTRRRGLAITTSEVKTFLQGFDQLLQSPTQY